LVARSFATERLGDSSSRNEARVTKTRVFLRTKPLKQMMRGKNLLKKLTRAIKLYKKLYMSDELNQGTQEPNENLEGNETLENEEVNFADEEKALWEEETTKKVGTLSAQKKHWRDKAAKALKDFEEYKKLHPDTKSVEPKEDKKEKKQKPDDELASLRGEIQEMRLSQSNPSLKSEQIKKAIAWAKAEGVEPQAMIDSDEFQALVKIQAEKAAAAQSAPNPSNRFGSAKTDYSKLSAEQIAELSDEEYPKYQKWLKETNGGNRSGLTIKHRIGV
jgi:hypothetical protein